MINYCRRPKAARQTADGDQTSMLSRQNISRANGLACCQGNRDEFLNTLEGGLDSKTIGSSVPEHIDVMT